MQDRFGSIARAYYKEAYGAILVYDVARGSSFETVPRWKGEIDDKVSQLLRPSEGELMIYLVHLQ